MPKRKHTSGYKLSSKDFGNEFEAQLAAKKTKLYEPPHLSLSTPNANTKAKPPTFNFPVCSFTSATPQTSCDPSSRPKAVTKVQKLSAGGSTSQDTPSAPRAPITSLSDDEVPISPTNIKGKGRAPVPVVLEDEFSTEKESDSDLDRESVPDTGIPSHSGTGTSCQLVEQRMDDLLTQIQLIDAQTEQIHHETKEQFTMLNKGIKDLHLLVTTALVPCNPIQDDSMKQPAAPHAKRMTNPPLTNELSTLIIKVCEGFQSHIGNKLKGDMVINTQKKHTRATFKTATMVNGMPAPHPSFVDANRHDDYFPSKFANLITGYRQPFLNYDKPMQDQMGWVPTVLECWKASVPHNTGTMSSMLQNLSDEEILILIHDGPFQTARNDWWKNKKMMGEIEEQHSHAWQEKRTKQKLENHSQCCDEVPELMKPAYDWMFHPGMMSHSLTSYYEANDLATEKMMKKTVLKSRRSVKHEVVLVAPSIPQLLTGKCRQKKILCIGVCGFSKKFRQADAGLFERSHHLLDLALLTAPDIGAFLDKYPKEDVSDLDLEPEAIEAYDNYVGLDYGDDLEGGDAINTQVEVKDEGEDADTEEDPDKPKAPKIVPDKTEAEPGKSPAIQQHQTQPKVAPKLATPTLSPAPTRSMIDPTLRSPHPSAPGMPVQALVQPLIQPPVKTPDISRSPSIETSIMHDYWGNPVSTDMPPPPELSNEVNPNTVPAGVGLERKKAQDPVDGAQSELQGVAPVKRKPGRPRGSKNKPKTTETQNAALGQPSAPPVKPKKHGRPPKVVK